MGLFKKLFGKQSSKQIAPESHDNRDYSPHECIAEVEEKSGTLDVDHPCSELDLKPSSKQIAPESHENRDYSPHECIAEVEEKSGTLDVDHPCSKLDLKPYRNNRNIHGLIRELRSKCDALGVEHVDLMMTLACELANESAYKAVAHVLLTLPQCRKHAVDILRARAPLYSWLADSLIYYADSSSRSTYAQVLAEADASCILMLLEGAITGNDERTACFAAESLGAIGDKSSIDVLIQAVTSGKEWLAPSAGEALKMFHHEDLCSSLLPSCSAANAFQRLGAITAISGCNTPRAAEILVDHVDDPDKSIRRAAKRGLIEMGELGSKTLTNKIGPDEAIRILDPDQHVKNVKALKDERKRELEASMSHRDKIIDVLRSLKPLARDNSWLHGKIVVLVGHDPLTDDEYRDYEERISAGRTGNILETAQIAFEFWRSQKQSWRLSGVAIIDSRRVVLQGSKLTLKLKGSYGNGKPCDDAFPLTIVRLGEDEFLCLKEIQGDRY